MAKTLTPEEAAEIGIEVRTLKEVALDGEGADRAFETPSGTRFRARVRMTDAAHMKPPEGVDPAAIAPTSITLTLSIALLDEQNAVQSTSGGYLIMPVHELQFDADALTAEGFDIDRLIQADLLEMMLSAERTIANRTAALETLESAWGVVPPEAVPSAPREPLPMVAAEEAE